MDQLLDSSGIIWTRIYLSFFLEKQIVVDRGGAIENWGRIFSKGNVSLI